MAYSKANSRSDEVRYGVIWRHGTRKSKHNKFIICNDVANWTTCFGLLGGHHQV